MRRKPLKKLLPLKPGKLKKSRKEGKQANQELASRSIRVEKVIGERKILGMSAEHYRNRRKRVEIRFDLLYGSYDFEIKLSEFNFASGIIRE